MCLEGPKLPVSRFCTFAQVVHKGAKLCFLSISTDAYSLDFQTCFALQATDQPTSLPAIIVPLLEHYSEVFAERTSLPLPRPGFDHKIQSKDEIQPFNLHPYRFYLVHKNIIDNIVLGNVGSMYCAA
ncbi:unnamed protein product [Vicia faba]|uniref:Uncharacterized protein n=1 Tax=Vicia faba TaxID=3906 RepID=A0AAV0ZAB4_VICFA|nr:unnamed protein product [Vicia faba]